MIAPAQRPSPTEAPPAAAFRILGIVLVLAAVLVGCPSAPDDAPAELVAEDVGSTIEIPIEDDVQEARRPRRQLSGVLPSDYPADVPLSLPASLVDFGPAEDPWVELETSRAAKVVAGELVAGMRSKGWSVERAENGWVGQLDGRTVRFTVDGRSAGAVYRIHY